MEFRDACRQYRSIGLCCGPPGVGKTLSARHYANWDQIKANQPYSRASATALRALLGSETIFYTPKVVNSPGQVERAIQYLRHRLYTIRLESIDREEKVQRAVLQRREKAREVHALFQKDWYYGPPEDPGERTPTFADVTIGYHQKRLETPDPTSLLIIDEADRLTMAALEQVRDIFDKGDIGLILIGMPGIEKRLARYPYLYSRVGFVHAFHPLNAGEVRALLQHKWAPSGVALPEEGIAEETAVSAIIRITGGNFRLLHRLLTQITRLVEINALSQVTHQVVEAARESLVIGGV